jgi:hypothetical protein
VRAFSSKKKKNFHFPGKFIKQIVDSSAKSLETAEDHKLIIDQESKNRKAKLSGENSESSRSGVN